MLLLRKNIFIVEDHPLSRAIYQIVLGKNGANLIFDSRGIETIGKLKRCINLDLIILDLMLPRGKSGFEIYEEIQTVSEYSRIPIIAVSASEETVAITQAQKLGLYGFIPKPIDALLFPQQILRIMNGESVWASGLT